MGVDVQRRADRFVSERRGERLDVYAALEAQFCECMSDRVEWNVFAPCPLEDPGQGFPAGRGITRGILFDRRGEHPAGIYIFSVFSQDGHNGCREDNGSDGSLRFGNALPVRRVDLPLNAKLSRREVEILPPESDQLSAPQSGEEIEKEHLVEALFLCLKEELPDFSL